MKKFRLPKVDLRTKKREAARSAGRKIPTPPKDLFEPQLSENAAYIAKTRYSFRDEKGEPIETPKELFWRVAYYIGAADRIYLPARLDSTKSAGKTGRDGRTHLTTAREFYAAMASQKFIPNTPTLVNSGKRGQSLSACFVLPVDDDLESILKTMRDMAMIHKMGGGTGFSFSRLRPKDDVIGTSKGKTTGPVAFLQAYNDVTSQIRQGGVRRGANMGILHYTHPDVLRFAVHKVDEFSLTNFNISVTVNEDFMQKVKEDAKFVIDTEQSRSVYPESDRSVEDLEQSRSVDDIVGQLKEAYAIRDLDLKNVRVEEAVTRLYDLCKSAHEGEGYELVNPRTGEVTGKLNAKKVFDLITKLAWQYGDPGMILIDRVNGSRANPTPKIGLIEATNPCAEQPLLAYDACTLGSINLYKFVYPDEKGRVYPEQSRRVEDPEHSRRIDWEGLKKTVHTAIHFLDNVLDMNEYPVAEIDQMTSAIRRVGLGVMGWADMLVKLGIGYNTPEAFTLAEKVMQFVQSEADTASADLAKVRGTFPAFKGSIYDKPERKSDHIKVRNGARTTIAPTGTISLLADCSSGIEPHFALTFAKNTIEGKRLFNTNPYFLEALKDRGLSSDDVLTKIEENKGSVQNLDEIPEDLRQAFVVAGDISPKDHVRMAAAFQKFTDNGISKTINFPNEATVDDVREAYWLSYELGCNMITIYRDGSREKQVLEVKKEGSYYDQLAGKNLPAGRQGSTVNEHGVVVPIKRPTPQEAWGMRVRKKADVGPVYTSVFRDTDGAPVEVFVTIGKTGGYVAGAAEVTGRLASRALKYGATLEEIASDLVGISCGTPYGIGPDSVLSAFDAVGKSLIEISRAKQLQLPVVEDLPAGRQEPEQIQTVAKSEVAPSNGLSNGQSNGQTNGKTPTNGANVSKISSSLSLRAEGLRETEGQMTLPKIRVSLPAIASGASVRTEELNQRDDQLQTTSLLNHKVSELETKFNSCPDCGSPLIFAEGCKKCINPTCGWSKCS